MNVATFSRSFASKKMENKRMWMLEKMSECMCCCFLWFLDGEYLNIFMLMERSGGGEAKDETDS